MSEQRLQEALRRLGHDEAFRGAVLTALRGWEARNAEPGVQVRENTTGPVVDALFEPGEAVQFALSDGTRLRIPYRSKIARDIAMRAKETPDHAFEPQTTRLLLRWAPSAKTVVIGGAYAGDHACVMARAMPTEGRIIAFEPNPEQRRFLEENLATNAITQVQPVPLGLWDEDDVRLKLEGTDACAWVVPTRDDDGIPATTLDRYLAEAGVDDVDVILLDIEGSELRALRGARRILDRPRDRAPDLIFEINRAFCDWSDGLAATEIVSFVRSFGYDVWALRDFQTNIDMSGCAIELVELDGCYLEGPPHGFNMVATKRPEQFDGEGVRILRGVSPKLLLHRDPVLHAPTEWR